MSKNEGNAPTICTSDHTETTGAWHSSSTGLGCVPTRQCRAVSQQAFSTYLWLPVTIQCLLKNTEYNKEQQWIHTPIHVLRVDFHVMTSYCSISWQIVLSHLYRGLRWESAICSLQYTNITLIFLKVLYLLCWVLFINVWNLQQRERCKLWPGLTVSAHATLMKTRAFPLQNRNWLW